MQAQFLTNNFNQFLVSVVDSYFLHPIQTKAQKTLDSSTKLAILKNIQARFFTNNISQFLVLGQK